MNNTIELPRISINDPKWEKLQKDAEFLYKKTNMTLQEIANTIGVHFRNVEVMIYMDYMKKPGAKLRTQLKKEKQSSTSKPGLISVKDAPLAVKQKFVENLYTKTNITLKEIAKRAGVSYGKLECMIYRTYKKKPGAKLRSQLK